jgi:sialic acid synthase SpsE
MSLEPDEMAQFVRTIADLERALGVRRRILHDSERKRRLAVRRSVFLAGPAVAGQRMKDADVLFRRPGFGVGPDQFESMGDAVFRRDLPAGHMVTLTDLE